MYFRCNNLPSAIHRSGPRGVFYAGVPNWEKLISSEISKRQKLVERSGASRLCEGDFDLTPKTAGQDGVIALGESLRFDTSQLYQEAD